MYDSFHWKCYIFEIHQIEKFRFLGILWYNFKFTFHLNLNLYWVIWVCRFVWFWGCSISSGYCHNAKYNPTHCKSVLNPEPCKSVKKPCVSAKVPYISVKEPYMCRPKKTCKSRKEPFITDTQNSCNKRAYVHIYTYYYIYKHSQAHAHMPAFVTSDTYTCACEYTCVGTHIHAQLHIQTFTDTRTHACVRDEWYIHMYMWIHLQGSFVDILVFFADL